MRRRLGVLLATATALLAPATAEAITYAPVDQPGPALSVPQAALNASLLCKGNLSAPGPGPALLVPGTGENPPHNFGWNYEPALDKLGIPWCAVTLPDNALSDIQVAGEYVVNGIRTMYAQAGRRISLIGHSQGGMLPRWALRFWPDTRAMVDDQIGLAPSNHGTISAQGPCTLPCPPAFRQQSSDAEFIKALNSHQETFPGISYTEIYTHTDWVVVPNLDDQGSSSIHGGGGQISNVAIQDVCPPDLSEHLAIGTMDNVAYALAIDALEHPGPADPSRIPQSVCTQYFMPGVNPATALTDFSSASIDLAENIGNGPSVSEEPPLKCYVTGSCSQSGVAAAVKARKCKKRKRHRAAEASKKRHCKHKKRRG